MSQLRIIALALVVLGIISFSYEGYITYKTRDKVIDAGPVEVVAEKTHKLHVPPVAGAVAMVGGVILLVASVKKV